MPILRSTYFRESQLAHELLDGLSGLEIGGSAHNSFGLDTLNVDRIGHEHPDFAPYASEQVRLGGKVMPVDIVAPGDCVPVEDKSFDFVICSHVIEHFYDPISAIKEWMRIARQYIFIVVPHRDALESDHDKPLTELKEHLSRFYDVQKHSSDEHHSRWNLATFCDMCEWMFAQEWGAGWVIHKALERDDKVGNGHCIVLKFSEA